MRKRLLALLAGYLLLELVCMPVLARTAPLRLRAWLPAPMYVLGETSKSGFLPRNYVLVLGDSYAEGQGDWLTNALRKTGNPPFQATDVLHGRTGRDVVTFGSGGADNITSTAYLVEKRFTALRRVGWGDPSDILVYFYEGNDLNDNLRQARRRFGLEERTFSSYDDGELDELIEGRARKGFWMGLPGMFFAPYVLLNAIKGGTAGGKHGEGETHVVVHATEKTPETEFNLVAVGGERFEFAGPFQGPGMELTEEETEFSLRLFEHALAWTKQRFPKASIQVVYLPSPASCYELISLNVRTQTYEEREDVYSACAIHARSAEVRRRVGEIAGALDLGFIDTTEEFMHLAAEELIHGPGDGKHLNQTGYTLLGELLARRLKFQPE